VIKGGLETINVTEWTSNNVEVLCVAARKMSLFSVDTVTTDIMVFSGDPKSIEKTGEELGQCNTNGLHPLLSSIYAQECGN
jgi:hypothetical protein